MNELHFMNDIKFSFIIPAHNEESNIEECINSVQNNMIDIMYENYEIIIIADGCTDKTEDIVISMKETNSKLFLYRTEYKNVSSVRNYGSEVASGDYYFFIDGDTIIKDNLFRNVILDVLEKYDRNVIIGTLFHPKEDDHCNPLYEGMLTTVINKYLTYTNTSIGPFIGVNRYIMDKVKFGYILSEDVLFIKEASKYNPLYILPDNYVLTDSFVCQKTPYTFFKTYVTKHNTKQLYSDNLVLCFFLLFIIIIMFTLVYTENISYNIVY